MPEHATAPAPVSILVVDDAVENLRLLSNMLGEYAYEIRPVTGGRDALRAIEHAPPDLILLDVTMPEMDGFEVCRRLRALGHTDIPVVFLTALTDVENKVRAFEVGGDDYITKPFQVEEVLARVRLQLSLRAARKDLLRSIERLQELERLRDDLVKMIVHDLRTPLTALLMQLQLLRMDLTGEAAQTADDATASATRLSSMASTLLDVSRLEEGKMPLERSSVDLSALAVEVRKELAGIEADRTIEVVAAAPVIATCDAALIRRVLENLVSNGIKHTPRGGRLRIRVEPCAAGVRVAVEDEGPGVPAAARERIFQKFGAVEVRHDSAYHSVGLGLAFCRLAVEAHGGTIGVSDAVPHGSVFAFELPA
jgi:signal transduction histidine kinase